MMEAVYILVERVIQPLIKERSIAAEAAEA